MEYLGLVGRLVVGLVFVVAAGTKLRDPDGFRAAVANYRLLPAVLVTPVARALPVLELAIGALLLLGVLVVPVSVLAALVLAGFAGAIAVNVQRGRKIGCGCGFRRRQVVSRRLVLRNAALTGAALAAAVWPSAALALAPGPGVPASTLSTSDALAVLVATASAAALLALVVEVRGFLSSRGSSLVRAVARG